MNLIDFFDRKGWRYEVIVVDDGSNDDTAAWLQTQIDQNAVPGLVLLRLSRNFGKEAALTAGLAAAGGDAVVLLDNVFLAVWLRNGADWQLAAWSSTARKKD